MKYRIFLLLFLVGLLAATACHGNVRPFDASEVLDPAASSDDPFLGDATGDPVVTIDRHIDGDDDDDDAL